MKTPEIVEVDPRDLHLRPTQSADLYKLHTQIARYGANASGMPAPWVYRGSDGALVLYNGVTMATRIARLSPGTKIRMEVVGSLKRPVGQHPKVEGGIP